MKYATARGQPTSRGLPTARRLPAARRAFAVAVTLLFPTLASSHLGAQPAAEGDSGRAAMEVEGLAESSAYRTDVSRTVDRIRSMALEAGIENPKGLLVLYRDSAEAPVEAIPVETNLPRRVWNRALPVVDDFLERHPLGDRWCHILTLRLDEGPSSGDASLPNGEGSGEDRAPRLLNRGEIISKLSDAAAKLAEQPPPAGEDTNLRRLRVGLRLLVDAKGRVPAVLDVRSSGNVLADAMVASVARQMRFEPALLDGSPAPVAVGQPVTLEYYPACNYRCVVSVSNHYNRQIQVYYHNDGRERRLGSIHPSGTRNFTLPMQRGGHVTLLAKMDGRWVGRERVLLRRSRATTVHISRTSH